MKDTNSKETILKCALTLFFEKGYDRAGINEIVQLAGVTKPTLYYFFQSKEGLFEEILKRYYEPLNTILAKESVYFPKPEVYDRDVFPTLLKIVKVYFAFAMDNKLFYMMLLSLTFAPPNAQVTKIIEPYNVTQYQTVIQCFEHIAKVHVNLKGKERQCAYHLIALINANIGLWNHGYVDISDQKAEFIVQQFLHGIFS